MGSSLSALMPLIGGVWIGHDLGTKLVDKLPLGGYESKNNLQGNKVGHSSLSYFLSEPRKQSSKRF